MSRICSLCLKPIGIMDSPEPLGKSHYIMCKSCRVKYKDSLIASGLSQDAISNLEKQLPNSNISLNAFNILTEEIGLLKKEAEYKVKSEAEKIKSEAIKAEKDRIEALKYSSFISVTSPSIEGRHIQRYLGVQHSELVLGIGLSNNVGAGLTDLFGLQDSSLSAKLHDAKKTALAQLKKQCIDIGANACISVDFDLMTLGGNIIVASASGTAVVLAEENKEE